MMRSALFVLNGAHSLGLLALVAVTLVVGIGQPPPAWCPSGSTLAALWGGGFVSSATLTMATLYFPMSRPEYQPSPQGVERAIRLLRRWWFFTVLGTILPVLGAFAVAMIWPDRQSVMSGVLIFMLVPWYLAMLFGPWIATYINWFRLGHLRLGELFFGARPMSRSPSIRARAPRPIPASDIARLPVSLEEVDRFSWGWLTHGQGRALDLPKRIRSLLTVQEEVRQGDMGDLCDILADEGGLHTATPYSLLPLIQLLREGKLSGTLVDERLLELLEYCSDLGDRFVHQGWLFQFVRWGRPREVPILTVEDAVGFGHDVYPQYLKDQRSSVRESARALVRFCEPMESAAAAGRKED